MGGGEGVGVGWERDCTDYRLWYGVREVVEEQGRMMLALFKDYETRSLRLTKYLEGTAFTILNF